MTPLHRGACSLLLVALALPACSYGERSPRDLRAGDSIASPATWSDDAPGQPPAVQILPLGAGYGARWGAFDLYFTSPETPLAAQFTGGVDGPLVEALDSARLTIDMAAYRLDSQHIRIALLRAQDRGVRVRLVMEADDLDGRDAVALLEAGIPIVGDWPDGLMHDKFVVVDEAEVWTGSMNFTSSGIYSDHNNLLRIRSSELAAIYTTEFEEMYVDRHFGPVSPAGGAPAAVRVDGVPVHAYFAPEDSVGEELVRLVRSADTSIYFLAFSFTSDALGGALRDQARRGVLVQGVVDADQVRSNQGTEYDAFRQAGLTVLTDGSSGQMHHKVLIIDEAVVVMGSYNFSGSAERRNDENALVIESPSLAAQFLAEFHRLFAAAQP